MRAAEVIAADDRFLGVFEGVGSIVMGSMVGGASVVSVFGCEGLSESDSAPVDTTLRELKTCFLGVL